MANYGRVVGGDFLNSTVTASKGGKVVVQTGLKWRKLGPENVAEWDEVAPENQKNAMRAVGTAVAGAVLPGTFGKAASAAVGASMDSMGPSHIVRIDWTDAKKSLIKLPDNMFKHLELVLEGLRAVPAEPIKVATEEVARQTQNPTVSEQAFSLISGIIKDRIPPRANDGAPTAPANGQSDVAEQLTKLASLRDAGVLTDEEFAAKKVELLARF
ncbi:SHOCT domain-containing protein [Demequina aurantiaca]|uniref:SHOCT domain-containing protein n=1 Tax=Demequina aurantiaca TaxID=676200 RepID=UPI000783A9CC|nr:SHOCT domain-containing protein [Demequina aurantiaca]